MKSRPPAVVIGPPRGSGVPVLGTPSAVNSSNSPSGVRHATSPLFTLTAISSLHGGCWQGHFLGPSQKRPPIFGGALSGPTRLKLVPSLDGTILLILARSCEVT